MAAFGLELGAHPAKERASRRHDCIAARASTPEGEVAELWLTLDPRPLTGET